MTLPRLHAIAAHWEAVPPLGVCVAAIATFCGMEKAKGGSRGKPASSRQDLAEMAQQMNAAGFAAGSKPEWLRAAEADPANQATLAKLKGARRGQ